MHPDNQTAPAGRGPRRPGKGRHFRPSRRPRPASAASAAQPQTQGHDIDEPPVEPREPIRSESAAEDTDFEPTEPVEKPASYQRPERAPKTAETFARGPAISRAIDHVQEVITDLKSALEEMELALELLEEAERQKLDDEREIKALQKAIERVNRFRGGQRSGERSSDRSERSERSDRGDRSERSERSDRSDRSDRPDRSQE